MKKILLLICSCLIFTATAFAKPIRPFPMVMYSADSQVGSPTNPQVGPPTDAEFQELKDWGINYVHSYSLGRDIKKDQQFFDLAQKYHLKVAANLDGKSRVGVEGGLDAMRAYVEHFKNNPALGFWYLYDEPPYPKIKAADILPFYQMLKAETPDVPVAVCHAWTDHWYSYTDVQDILINDLYPVTGAPFPDAKLNQLTAFTKGAVHLSDTVIPVIQFFNWQNLAKPDEIKLRGYAVDQLRYPNTAEMRYMCFSSIAQGARGLAFYSYFRRTPPDPKWAEQTAAPVLRQVRKFADQVLDPGTLKWRSAENDCLISVWQVQDKTYMILANATSQRRDIDQSLEQIPSGDLQPWGKTRKVRASIKSAKITVSQAKPWEVFIWEIVSK